MSSLGALTVWWVSLFTSYCTSYFPGIRINYHKLFEPARNLHLLSRWIHGAFLGIAHIFLNVSAKFQLYNIFFWVKLWNDCSTIKSTVGTVPYRTYKYLVEIIQPTLNKSEHRVINSSSFVNEAAIWETTQEELQVSYASSIHIHPYPWAKLLMFNGHFR